MTGKGSRRRPRFVSEAELARRWRLAFGSGPGKNVDFEIQPEQIQANPEEVVHFVATDYKPLGVAPWPKAGESKGKA